MGREEIDALFTGLAKTFSDCTSYVFELQACGVSGDMAYTVGLEHNSASVDGQRRTYTLRATHVYRREDGAWRVAHERVSHVHSECRMRCAVPAELFGRAAQARRRGRV
ncbi:YybH family protein [Streptomyces sp. NPDC056470]|uniref:YybH family protein n=1 Tax=Streptomyces sp. NPDC056470 TaxID=3345831 RepID=UPI003682B37C